MHNTHHAKITTLFLINFTPFAFAPHNHTAIHIPTFNQIDHLISHTNKTKSTSSQILPHIHYLDKTTTQEYLQHNLANPRTNNSLTKHYLIICSLIFLIIFSIIVLPVLNPYFHFFSNLGLSEISSVSKQNSNTTLNTPHTSNAFLAGLAHSTSSIIQYLLSTSTQSHSIQSLHTKQFTQISHLVHFHTICQKLFIKHIDVVSNIFSELDTSSITVYECLDTSRSDLYHAEDVCTTDQLHYMHTYGSSFCGTPLLTNANYDFSNQNKNNPNTYRDPEINSTYYPHLCYNSSNLCRNPQILPNITCASNSTDNTLCDIQYKTHSILVSNKLNQPLRKLSLISLPVPVNSMSVKYNIICMLYNIEDHVRNLDCYPLNGLIPSDVASQIGMPSIKYSHSTLHEQNDTDNYFYTYNNSHLLGYNSCRNLPCYTPEILFFIRIYKTNQTPRCETIKQNNSFCDNFNPSKCLFSSNKDTALCFV